MQQKRTLGPQPVLLTNPVLLVGSVVEGKATFTTISWAGIVNSEPPMLSISVRPGRHIHRGISEHRTFSVNIPSAALLAAADYCGTVSGSRTDKTADCGFELFYGDTPHAPLICQAGVNIECTVHSIQNLGTHDLIIGQIREVHVDSDCLSDGKPDAVLLRPFSYASGGTKDYHALGSAIAKAYSHLNPPKA